MFNLRISTSVCKNNMLNNTTSEYKNLAFWFASEMLSVKQNQLLCEGKSDSRLAVGEKKRKVTDI